MNIVILGGNLGKAPKITQTEKTTIVNFSMATQEFVNGEKKTEWHNVVCFGKTAENAGKYLLEGSQVNVTGQLRTNKYEKNGETRYSTQVVAQRIEYVNKPEKKEGSRTQQSSQDWPDDGAPPIGGDDVPF